MSKGGDASLPGRRLALKLRHDQVGVAARAAHGFYSEMGPVGPAVIEQLDRCTRMGGTDVLLYLAVDEIDGLMRALLLLLGEIVARGIKTVGDRDEFVVGSEALAAVARGSK